MTYNYVNSTKLCYIYTLTYPFLLCNANLPSEDLTPYTGSTMDEALTPYSYWPGRSPNSLDNWTQP